jgi:hypothetical protein
MKHVHEYRRRAMATRLLAQGALSELEARQLRKIAREWDEAARIREEYLKTHPASSDVNTEAKWHSP